MTASPFDEAEPVDGSDATSLWRPDVLVELELHADRESIGEHPFRQDPRIEHAVHRRQVYRGGPLSQSVTSDRVACVLVVRAVLDHELHLIVRTQAVEVRPVGPRRLAAARTLDVENRDNGDRHARRAAVAPGLE